MVDDRFKAYDTRLEAVEKQLQKEVDETKARRLLDALYNRRLNYLAIGIEEAENWKETNAECCRKIVELFHKMNIPDPDLIKIVDCHRLGKKPTRVETEAIDGKTVNKCRPIIFKVADHFMIKTIKDNLSKLKTYYTNHPDERKVYFKRHIPKEMYNQRRNLQTKYTELHIAQREPEWRLAFKTAKYFIKDGSGVEYHNN